MLPDCILNDGSWCQTCWTKSEAIDYTYLPGFHVLKEIRKDALCLASTETSRIIRDGEKGGRDGGMEVGEEGTPNDIYTHIHYIHIITIDIRVSCYFYKCMFLRLQIMSLYFIF